MSQYTAQFETEIMPIPIGTADTKAEAQAIADDWNHRYGTTDPQFDDHAIVVETP